MNHTNFDIRTAMVTFLDDMTIVEGWIECFDLTVEETELEAAEIRDAAITFASNLWRSSEADFRCSSPDTRELLNHCWERRTGLFLKEASSLYPEDCCGITVSDIQQEVQG